MFSVELITLTIVTIINLVIVWIVASQSWRPRVNRYFIAAASFVSLWSIGTMLLIAGNTTELINAGRILFLISPMYTMLFLSLFASLFPSNKGKSFTLVNQLLFVLTVVSSAFIIYNPEYLISSIELHPGHNLFTVNPLWYPIYAVYFNIAVLITFSEFLRNLKISRGSLRQQVRYVFSGTLLAAVFSLITNLLLPILGIDYLIWLGPASTLFYVVTVSISIVKHQLFDIKLAAVRSIAYIGVLLTLSVIYYVFAYVLSIVIIGSQATDAISVSPLNILMALALAFLFQPIKRFFDKTTNSVFYRNDYKSEDFFGSISNLLTSTIDLRGLVEGAAKQIASTLKAEQVFFFLYYTNVSNQHMSAGTHGHAKVPIHDARLLDEYMATTTDKIIVTELLPDGSPVRRMFVSHKVAVVMPLRQSENIVGYVMLGEHKSGSYRKRDFNVLLAVSSELVIAIQNAMSLHEVRELNATLQQRINVATKELRSSNAQLKHLDEVKDEFMSMASHQLRTPLTSVKGYISMVLEGDAGNVTPKQQKLLVEAFKSSERMVGLIADFLNVSRLQTGKFIIDKTSFDLKDIVKQEVSDLEMIATSHEIKLRLKLTDHPLPVRADESKVRQVIMNYIDNAIYYSHPKGVIVINVDKLKDDAVLTVVDTGIGVPDDEQGRLFNKFFRAKNARKQRPDGTGVGLYLARRVISAHSGSLIFSSKEGKGSTFGFRIPLGKPVEQKAPVTESEPALVSAAK